MAGNGETARRGPLDPSRRRALASLTATAATATLPAIAPRGTVAAERGIAGFTAPEPEIDHWSSVDGEPTTFSIAASRGRWTFLKCFQYWCPGCHASGFPTLVDVQDAFGAAGPVAMAAIQTVFEGHSTNRADRIPEIRERYGLEMPIGHDAGDLDAEGPERWPATMRAYRTGGTPWLVLIDPAGTVVYDGFHVDPRRLIDFLEEQLG